MSCMRESSTNLQRTILCVEDNRANLSLIEKMIARRSDLKLVSTADGSVGVAKARVDQPAIILMDIHLSGISGYEAFKILRADPTTAHIPIIALSSDAHAHEIQRGIF
jgi:CheY-like chemotaxis protein